MSVAFAEGGITKLRREFKLLVSRDEADALSAALVTEHGGASPVATEVTSIYFDRPGYPLAERARRTPHDCIKVRTKEYYPDIGQQAAPRVVLEVKRERNGLTHKHRVWVPRSRLESVVKQGTVELPAVFGDGPLITAVAVTYVRHVYQRTEAWRVTVDRSVEFFRVSEEQAFARTRIGRTELGLALGAEPRVVVEVKHMGAELPEWLQRLGTRQATAYSKFSEGMARLLERGRQEADVHRLRGN